jgi:hypothetical protein
MNAKRIARGLRQLCSLRTAGLAAVGILLVAAGVATASIIRPGTGTESGFGPDSFAWDGTPASVPVAVADPSGNEQWAVRVYQSKDGFPCVEVGRLRGKAEDGTTDFGRVDAAGTFQHLPIEDGGSPVDLSQTSQALLVNRYRATDHEPATNAIFGMVRDDVKSVVLHLASGTSTLPISAGVFLAVVPESDLADARVEFTRSDGTSKTVELHSKPLAGSGEPPVGP